ncbi:MAG TPA: transporter substrate-binding domain-containing protein [Actinomycetota bacterium]|nr:transporter substrate-binding domain-containing protein [Actinomycetota bacterium]
MKAKALCAVLLLSMLAACDLPRDAEGTLERVRGGVLRVGVTESDPWVVLGPEGPSGVEVEIVRSLAAELDAKIEWTEGSVDELAAAVHLRELDLMVGGLTSTSKISSEVTFTHPYLTTQVVVAVPSDSPAPEDIAGLQVAVEKGTEGAGILEKTDAIPRPVSDVTRADGAVAIENYLLDDLGLEDTGLRLLESDHVMGAPHGENDWLVEVERFLLENTRMIESLLERGDGA